MSFSASSRVPAADACVLLSVRGLHAWGAVLVGVVFTAAGIAVDGATRGALGWGFKLCFVAGVVLAVLAVRRGSLFTAMVQTPILLAIGIVVGSRLVNHQGLLNTAIDVVKAFPTMAVSTAIVLVIGLVRFIAQPNRTARPPTRHATAGV